VGADGDGRIDPSVDGSCDGERGYSPTWGTKEKGNVREEMLGKRLGGEGNLSEELKERRDRMAVKRRLRGASTTEQRQYEHIKRSAAFWPLR
jgi:hypothetical protein